MAPRPESQERQASATGRYLDTANRCLVRQLRVLSRIGRHPAAVKLAEAVFKTMLETQETMVQTQELLTHSNDGRELRASSGRSPELDHDGRPKSHREGRPRSYMVAWGEETPHNESQCASYVTNR